MVRRSDPLDSADGGMAGQGSGSTPILDRLVARVLRGSGRRLAGTVPAWSEEAKDRLYRRMFPDNPPAGSISDAPAPALP